MAVHFHALVLHSSFLGTLRYLGPVGKNGFSGAAQQNSNGRTGAPQNKHRFACQKKQLLLLVPPGA